MTAKDATALFDELSLETYYGFNMKAELTQISDEDADVLRRFVKRCQKGRNYNAKEAA